MSKKWKDKTKGEYPIAAFVEHLPNGYAAGVVQHDCIVAVEWDPYGKCRRTTNGFARDYHNSFGVYDLVPAEPEVKYVEGVMFSDASFSLLPRPNLRLGFVDGKLVSAEVIE